MKQSSVEELLSGWPHSDQVKILCAFRLQNITAIPLQCPQTQRTKIFLVWELNSLGEIIFTDRVRSTREGYVLTRVCVSTPRGVPQPGPDGGGYHSQVQPPIRPGWGVPLPGGPLLRVFHLG